MLDSPNEIDKMCHQHNVGKTISRSPGNFLTIVATEKRLLSSVLLNLRSGLFFNYINSRHPNIRFTMEKEIDHKIAFLDVFINNDTDFPVTSVYRKKTFTGLLTNCFSFTSHSYKLSLIRTLVDRAYKINNTWLGFREDITKLTKILQKNLFPVHLVESTINHYLTLTRQDCNPPSSVSDTTRTFYFKLPYIGPFSIIA